MTIGKASILAAGFVGAVALGVAIGPSITDRLLSDNDRQANASATTAAPVSESDPVFAKPRKPRPAPAARRVATAEPAAPAVSVPATEPMMQARLKPVLNRGAKMELAAEGFRDAEQFATVAHAARNTEVPFVVLKHRVLEQGQTLADAIRESKPDVDANAEVERARAAAKSDLAAISETGE